MRCSGAGSATSTTRCTQRAETMASFRRTVGIRLNEPGEGVGDDGRATDTDAHGLADLFDELESIGFADTIVWATAKTPTALERIAEARELHLARR